MRAQPDKIVKRGGDTSKSQITLDGEIIEFRYPAGVQWACVRCGACCRTPAHRERRVLLLPGDVERLEQVGHSSFYEPSKEQEPFVGVMLKEGGECVFLGDGACEVYEYRALLCRMYPFWVEREGEGYLVKMDDACPGIGSGDRLDEEFFQALLRSALSQMRRR